MQTHQIAQTTGITTIQEEKKLMAHPAGMESMH